MLSLANFLVEGKTRTIQFAKNGDRKNPPSESVHIVKCRKEQVGVAFPSTMPRQKQQV
ncbi:hypothetical protein [Microcoleus sp. herbarium2]|uniref:hypothetical protein n=1 Tax=Microcoleus sp. herbarium2 TaxID=3055433 RepID=UPI002FD1D02C